MRRFCIVDGDARLCYNDVNLLVEAMQMHGKRSTPRGRTMSYVLIRHNSPEAAGLPPLTFASVLSGVSQLRRNFD